jgi:hypothetical protein
MTKDSQINAWRYMTVEKYRLLLESRSVYFCPIRRFIDEYEGFIHADLEEELFKLMSPIVGGEERVMWTVEHAKLHILDNCFVSCWTYWDRERKELWDEYVPGPGIVLKTNTQALHETLSRNAAYPLICGPVRYSNDAEGFGNRLHAPAFRGDLRELSDYQMLFFSKANYWIPDVLEHMSDYRFVFTKKEQFAHEREFRIVLATEHRINFEQWRSMIRSIGVEYGTCGALEEFCVDNEAKMLEIRQRPPPDGVLVPFDFAIVDEIRFSPYASSSFGDELATEMSKCGVRGIRIRPSELAKA